MKFAKSRVFIQKDFPHIDIIPGNDGAILLRGSGKLLPLCDLKNEGNCQDVKIIPSELHKEGPRYYWEKAPRKNLVEVVVSMETIVNVARICH